MKSQNEKILKFLQSGRTLTPISALSLFQCFRLAARIADLRKSGHMIYTNTITKNGKTFAGYKYAG